MTHFTMARTLYPCRWILRQYGGPGSRMHGCISSVEEQDYLFNTSVHYLHLQIEERGKKCIELEQEQPQQIQLNWTCLMLLGQPISPMGHYIDHSISAVAHLHKMINLTQFLAEENGQNHSTTQKQVLELQNLLDFQEHTSKLLEARITDLNDQLAAKERDQQAT